MFKWKKSKGLLEINKLCVVEKIAYATQLVVETHDGILSHAGIDELLVAETATEGLIRQCEIVQELLETKLRMITK